LCDPSCCPGTGCGTSSPAIEPARVAPAPAYGDYGIGVQAEAGADQSPYAASGYGDASYLADENAEPSSASAPPRQGGPRRFDRDRRRERPPHVTGEAAIRAANEANRAIGAMPDQLAIERRHKRYPGRRRQVPNLRFCDALTAQTYPDLGWLPIHYLSARRFR